MQEARLWLWGQEGIAVRERPPACRWSCQKFGFQMVRGKVDGSVVGRSVMEKRRRRVKIYGEVPKLAGEWRPDR